MTDASDVTFDDTLGIGATNVQTALEALFFLTISQTDFRFGANAQTLVAVGAI